MEYLISNGLLDELDGLNPTRALILQAYYALRRTYPPREIGTPQILAWIKFNESGESMPSDSLVLLTLREAEVAHRGRGRPRTDRPTPVPVPPLFPGKRPQPCSRARR
jgi:hypothetical protein